MSALIEARGVSRQFAVGQRLFAAKPVIRAVIDVDLVVGRGEVLGLVACSRRTAEQSASPTRI